jgi:hypothetical protein
MPSVTEERYRALFYMPSVTEERYWALFYMPSVTEERYWALFYMPLVTEQRYWALFYMPLYTLIHNLLNVLLQIANKWQEVSLHPEGPATGQFDQGLFVVFLGPRANAELISKISRCTVCFPCGPPNGNITPSPYTSH